MRTNVRIPRTGDCGGITNTKTVAPTHTLFGRSRQAILALLFGQPTRAFYLRQIAQLSGLAVGSIQRELANLMRAGLVTRTGDGAQVYFQANGESPIFAEMVGLMTKTAGVADVIRTALAGMAEKKMISMAFIYGSIAAGKPQASSDVDLMIIGSLKMRDLAPILRAAQERIGREVNPTIYQPSEFSQRIAADDHFLTQVMQMPRLMLVGSDDDLGRLAR